MSKRAERLKRQRRADDHRTNEGVKNLSQIINEAARQVGVSVTVAQKHMRGVNGEGLQGKELSAFVKAIGGGEKYEEVKGQFSQFHF